ncbi:Uncharacterised protein [Mycobacteroides abscessus subsp. massiliense]|nr:Uncharacterised protein [Mycobacteroides abscessus subsp. massiliense]
MFPRPFGQTEIVVATQENHPFDGLQAHGVQHLDGRLERQHLVHIEHIVDRLVPVRTVAPVRHPGRRAVAHALRGDGLLPAGAGPATFAAHQLPELPELLDPKPPRETDGERETLPEPSDLEIRVPELVLAVVPRGSSRLPPVATVPIPRFCPP